MANLDCLQHCPVELNADNLSRLLIVRQCTFKFTMKYELDMFDFHGIFHYDQA